MKKVVRIGNVQDQDTWRREDTMKMTANQRVELLMTMRENFVADSDKRLKKTVRIRKVFS